MSANDPLHARQSEPTDGPQRGPSEAVDDASSRPSAGKGTGTSKGKGKVAGTGGSGAVKRKRPSRGQPLSGFPLLVGFLGAVVSVSLWQVLLMRQTQVIGAQFHVDAETYIRTIEREFEIDLESLYALQSFYAGSEKVDRSEFTDFTSAVWPRHRAIRSLAWCPRVSHADRTQHQQTAEIEGMQGYGVRQLDDQGSLTPAAEREAYVPAYFVEPAEERATLLGLDFASIEPIREAIERSAVTGSLRLSPAVVLPRPGENAQLTFVGVHTVYKKGVALQTPEQREAAALGHVIGLLPLRSTIDASLQQLPLVGVDMWFTDLQTQSQFINVRVSNQRPERYAPRAVETQRDRDIRHQASIDIADRRVNVLAMPTPAYMAERRTQGPIAALLGGLLCTLTLMAYVASMTGRTEAVQRVVDKRTTQLREANANLEHEIADRVRYEQALRDSEAMYHSTVELLPMSIFRKDVDGRLSFANQHYCEFMEMSLDQLLGKSDDELFQSDLAEKYVADDRTVFETGEMLHDVEEHVDQQGRQHFVEIFKTPVRDATGAVVGVQGAFWDITSRKQAEIARRDMEALYHAMIDSLPMNFFRKDTEGRFIFGDAGFCEEIGEPLDRVLGKTDFDFFPEALAKKYVEDDKKIAATGETFHDVEEHRTPDGGVRYVEVVKTPVRDHRGQIVGTQGAYWDVTERKLAEDELLRLADIVASSEDAIIGLRLDGKISQWNPGAERIYRYTAAEALGKHIRLVVPDDRRGEMEENIARILRGEMVEHHQTVRRRSDGQLIDVSLSISPIRDAHGKVIGASTIARDVTEQTLAAERLKVSEERFRQLAEHVHEVFWVTTPDGSEMVYVSPAYESIWGRKCQALYDHPEGWLEAIHPEDRERVATQFIEKAGSSEYDTEYRVIRPDGAVRWIHDRGFAVENDQGEVYRIVGTAEDITAKKRVEEQLRASQALYQSLVDNLPDFIMVKDVRGRFVTANPALVRGLGCSSLEELVGKTDADIFPPELVEEYHADESRLLETGEPLVEKEERCVINGREVWQLTTKVPLYDDDGNVAGLVGITRDITGRKRQQQKLEETATALERSNSELQQFAYVASHDLQEPLRMISSYCQLLQRRYEGKLDEQADKFIEYAVDGARRMQTLIRDLLAFSRVETRGGNLEAIDLDEVARLAKTNLSMLIDDLNAEVIVDPLPTVEGDKTQLTQLFQNLINNAVKFRGEAPPRVHVSVSRHENGRWLIRVQDNGIGIAPEHQERIFQIFKRLHGRDKYEGTGIGLAVCKRVVERHGGEMWVESEAGEGAAFCFTLTPIEDVKPRKKRKRRNASEESVNGEASQAAEEADTASDDRETHA